MSSTVKSVAYVHTADIDPTVVKNGATWDGLVNICATAAENAPETPPSGYAPTQRNSRAWNWVGGLRVEGCFQFTVSVKKYEGRLSTSR